MIWSLNYCSVGRPDADYHQRPHKGPSNHTYSLFILDPTTINRKSSLCYFLSWVLLGSLNTNAMKARLVNIKNKDFHMAEVLGAARFQFLQLKRSMMDALYLHRLVCNVPSQMFMLSKKNTDNRREFGFYTWKFRSVFLKSEFWCPNFPR